MKRYYNVKKMIIMNKKRMNDNNNDNVMNMMKNEK